MYRKGKLFQSEISKSKILIGATFKRCFEINTKNSLAYLLAKVFVLKTDTQKNGTNVSYYYQLKRGGKKKTS